MKLWIVKITAECVFGSTYPLYLMSRPFVLRFFRCFVAALFLLLVWGLLTTVFIPPVNNVLRYNAVLLALALGAVMPFIFRRQIENSRGLLVAMILLTGGWIVCCWLRFGGLNQYHEEMLLTVDARAQLYASRESFYNGKRREGHIWIYQQQGIWAKRLLQLPGDSIWLVNGRAMHYTLRYKWFPAGHNAAPVYDTACLDKDTLRPCATAR